MTQTLDIGTRIELVPMDPHFNDITIGLYLEDQGGKAEYLVHSYSGLSGVDDRLDFVTNAMVALGGMMRGNDVGLSFPCGVDHRLACKRLFLEACKFDPETQPAPRPLQVFDKKAGCDIEVTAMGGGSYRISAEKDDVARRISAVAGGLIKLGQMEDVAKDQVQFPCGQNHDALVGLLLVRAPNVRAVLREEEQTASRGQLTAPSQQE